MHSLLLVVLASAQANSTGKTGHAVAGCGSCHGSADPTTTTTFVVPATTVAPGDTVPVQLRVRSASAARRWAGLDVAASGGALSAGADTRLTAGEITHLSTTADTAGVTTFAFAWTAPPSEGTYVLHGAGNAVDDSGDAHGDGWSLAPDLVLTVRTGGAGGGGAGSGGAGSGGAGDTGAPSDGDGDGQHGEEDRGGEGDADTQGDQADDDDDGWDDGAGTADTGGGDDTDDTGPRDADSGGADTGRGGWDTAADDDAWDGDARADGGQQGDAEPRALLFGCDGTGTDGAGAAALVLAAVAVRRRRAG